MVRRCKDNTFFWFGKHYANFYGFFDAFIVVQGQKIAFFLCLSSVVFDLSTVFDSS